MYFKPKKYVLATILSVMLMGCNTVTHSNPSESGLLPSPGFTLTSSLLSNESPLPETLKCSRDGGSGASPPLQWSTPPEGTQSFALVMHHYPNGTRPGVDNPSHYWLLWNIPGTQRSIAQGNPESIGTEGSDKDGKTTGYTPPCSPAGGGTHTYTLTLYALSAPPSSLGNQDRQDVTWANVTQAIKDITLGTAQLSFIN